MAESSDERRRIQLNLKGSLLTQLDALKKEWGIRNRGEVLERLLEEVFGPEELTAGMDTDAHADIAGVDDPDLDEQLALVLVGSRSLSSVTPEPGATSPEHQDQKPSRGSGIDLPGFVQRNTQQLRRSIQPDRSDASRVTSIPALSAELLHESLNVARAHWLSLYDQPPSDAVLEAAMGWLARVIWPQSDQSEGRTFTWSAACRAVVDLAGEWAHEAPTFERVIVMAGILEDPFSPSTLPLRIPTLIRSFMQRCRRGHRSTSFAMLEHTMTVQGALKLLQVHPRPEQGITLGQIREAYRDMARHHHPDSGGSVEAMRRVNEAYQLLKELYRHRSES